MCKCQDGLVRELIARLEKIEQLNESLLEEMDYLYQRLNVMDEYGDEIEYR